MCVCGGSGGPRARLAPAVPPPAAPLHVRPRPGAGKGHRERRPPGLPGPSPAPARAVLSRSSGRGLLARDRPQLVGSGRGGCGRCVTRTARFSPAPRLGGAWVCSSGVFGPEYRKQRQPLVLVSNQRFNNALFYFLLFFYWCYKKTKEALLWFGLWLCFCAYLSLRSLLLLNIFCNECCACTICVCSRISWYISKRKLCG